MKKIYIYNSDPNSEETIFYPEPAVKNTPEWYRKLPFLNDFNFRSRLGNGIDKNFLENFREDKKHIKQSTAKGCPAVYDSISSGYILKAWTDILVSVNDNYEIMTKQIENGVLTNSQSSFDTQEMFHSDSLMKNKNIPKLNSPLFVRTDPGLSLLITHPMYHFNENWISVPGIVCTDKYPIQFKWMFNWIGEPGNYVIEYGTPLLQIIPIVRGKTKIEITNKKIDTPISKCPVMQAQRFIKSQWEYVYKTNK